MLSGINIFYVFPHALIHTTAIESSWHRLLMVERLVEHNFCSVLQNPHSDGDLRNWIFDCMKCNCAFEDLIIEVVFGVDVVFVPDFARYWVLFPVLVEDRIRFVRFGTVNIQVCPDASANLDIFVFCHQILEIMRASLCERTNLDACCQIWPEISDQLVGENDARTTHTKCLSMRNIIIRIATEASAADVSRDIGVDIA